MGRLQDKRAIVTGGARGIGRAIAVGLASEGATVVVSDVHADEAHAVADLIVRSGGRATACRLDVSDAGACAALAADIDGSLGPLSILINNAGIIFPGRIDAPEAPDNWARTLAVNVGGPFNMCRAFYTQLKETKGAVVNIASIRSFVAAGNATAYATSKGAVMQLTKALAVEWGGEGIRVNAIAPGFVESNLVPQSEKTPEREAAITARTPLRRQGSPDEIAGAAIFLASEEARFLTGAILLVDGGYLAA